jgi:hypothetical protein
LGFLFAFFCVFALADPAAAGPTLGVNYYGESLMGANGIAYIPRTLPEIAYDLDQIHQISGNVKIYMNPFVDQNLPWVRQILQLAKQRQMYTVVNMMVDDRQLDDANWNAYSIRVTNACAALAGQADEILVGNEIILHSPLDKTDIKNRVVILINNCTQVFPGPVSYEEFWWVHDVWQGYPGKIYLMQYEDLPIFQQNTMIMDQMFGSNALVGEWGEDLLEGSIEHDENWQRDQIALRYNILSQTRTPTAYIFTYKEQSWNAFGIVRPDGAERPVFAYLKTLGFGVDGPIGPPPPPPPLPSSTTVHVVNTFMADLNAVFVCNANGFTPTAYSWNFGDGSSSLDRGVNDVYHSFSSNGTKTITCTASNGTINATGGITINVNGRGRGPALVQQVTPHSTTYTLYCDAIGYKPGFCQQLTSTNGFSFDWGCTSGSPGFGNLSIDLGNDGQYTLRCVMHLLDSNQLPGYYDEGITYHADTCNAPRGCVLVQANLQFVVGNGTQPVINDTVNTTINTTVTNSTGSNQTTTNTTTEPPVINSTTNSTTIPPVINSTAEPIIDQTTDPVITNTGSRGGGGGGGGSIPTSRWNCGNWSVCIKNAQTQTCTLISGNATRNYTQYCIPEKMGNATKAENASKIENMTDQQHALSDMPIENSSQENASQANVTSQQGKNLEYPAGNIKNSSTIVAPIKSKDENTSRITGAVIGAGNTLGFGTMLIMLAIVAVAMIAFKKRNSMGQMILKLKSLKKTDTAEQGLPVDWDTSKDQMK